jgi:serine/threonine protein phosphatase PrpC
MANPSDSKSAKAGGLQAMLARLRGMVEAMKEEAPASDAELSPEIDAPEAAAIVEPPPAEAVTPPQAEPVIENAAETPPVAEPVAEFAASPQTPPRLCPLCQAPRNGDTYCGDCGYIFPPDPPVAAPARDGEPAEVPMRLHGRYELGEKIGERGPVTRYRGLSFENGARTPVTVLRMAVTEAPRAEPVPAEAIPANEDKEVLPSFDDPPTTVDWAEPVPESLVWPSNAWERSKIEASQHPTLPAVLDSFVEDGCEYLVEELPAGQPLWDAWDDPTTTAEQRFGYLKMVAEALQALHTNGAMLEALRPELVTITPDGLAKITDLSDLLPLPLPPEAPIRASLYSAPELAAFSPDVDARADLYSFGAMLYALHVGRELAEMDFERPGFPKPFIPRFPDVHPLFGRLVMKTFCRDIAGRFPTDEAAKEDATGFAELIRTLDVCRRTFDTVRLEIAAWTTTGMVRTGNEDAFALLHTAESRQDDMAEGALIFLADGMGGYDAGEVAAALAIQSLRKFVLEQGQFAFLAGQSTFPADGGKPRPPEQLDVEKCKQTLNAALKEANRFVYTSSRRGVGKRGMGCTAEIVYVDGRNVVVGHVGDSRTYHLREGRLIQLTRDQTLVNRLVELGTLRPDEAEDHPRKNELQQAIGGQPDVDPGLYHGVLKPGDWVVVCSDGVSNHVPPDLLKEMLQGEAASAEMAARRLVNLVNIEGATDNATVVVIRAT